MKIALSPRMYKVLAGMCIGSASLNSLLLESLQAQSPNPAIRQPAGNGSQRYTNAPANQQAQPQQALPQQYSQQQNPQQAYPAQAIPGQQQQQLTPEQMMQQMKQNAVMAPNAQAVPQGINAPDFIPLPPEKDQLVKQILGKWQMATQGIERYKCNFIRWQYDMTKNSNPAQYHTAAQGVVRYMSPDKGMFRVDELAFFQKDPRNPQSEPSLRSDPNQFGEWWICDGKSVYLYDRTDKKATKYMLPPEMQGKQVFNSPLPFFFGVDAKVIEQRFWVNPLPDAELNNQPIHVLSVFPKTQADAVNYHHVTVFLDKKESLPVAIEICMPNWSEKTPNREFFEFRERDSNWNMLDKLKENMSLFKEEFIPKDPPAGWKVEERPYVPEESEVDPARVANPIPGQQPGLRK